MSLKSIIVIFINIVVIVTFIIIKFFMNAFIFFIDFKDKNILTVLNWIKDLNNTWYQPIDEMYWRSILALL